MFLAFAISMLRAASSFFRCLASRRRGEIDARPARLGQANGNRLFGGLRSVLAFANVVHFFANELPRLRRRRFPLAFILLRSFHGFLFRLDFLLIADRLEPRTAAQRGELESLKPQRGSFGDILRHTTRKPRRSAGNGRMPVARIRRCKRRKSQRKGRKGCLKSASRGS